MPMDEEMDGAKFGTSQWVVVEKSKWKMYE
jgi:hypothetical protein